MITNNGYDHNRVTWSWSGQTQHQLASSRTRSSSSSPSDGHKRFWNRTMSKSSWSGLVMPAHIQSHMRLMLYQAAGQPTLSTCCLFKAVSSVSILQHKHEVQACAQPISFHNNNDDDSNHQHAFQLMLGTCRTSLVSPEQLVLCIPVSRLRPTLTLLTTRNTTSLELALGRPDGQSPLTLPNKNILRNLLLGIRTTCPKPSESFALQLRLHR